MKISQNMSRINGKAQGSRRFSDLFFIGWIIDSGFTAGICRGVPTLSCSRIGQLHLNIGVFGTEKRAANTPTAPKLGWISGRSSAQ